jgi:ribonuclease HII
MDYNFESELISSGYEVVCGVDEAGRGPLCGPVCAAACILPCGLHIEGLNDSKKLSEKKREKLFDVICNEAVAYSVAFASVEEIDELNILEATLLAMRRAVEGLSVTPDYLLIDGNCSRSFTIPAKAVIKGDALVPSIAAASILAKVTRDRLCAELDKEYPQYNIAKHKGYGTKEHMALIKEHGISPIHRKSFIHLDKLNNK